MLNHECRFSDCLSSFQWLFVLVPLIALFVPVIAGVFHLSLLSGCFETCVNVVSFRMSIKIPLRLIRMGCSTKNRPWHFTRVVQPETGRFVMSYRVGLVNSNWSYNVKDVIVTSKKKLWKTTNPVFSLQSCYLLLSIMEAAILLFIVVDIRIRVYVCYVLMSTSHSCRGNVMHVLVFYLLPIYIGYLCKPSCACRYDSNLTARFVNEIQL